MGIEIEIQYSCECAADAILVLGCEDSDIDKNSLPEGISWVKDVPGVARFKGTSEEVSVYYTAERHTCVICAGLGKLEKLGIEEIRKAVARAARKCRELELKSAYLPLAFLAHLPGGRDRLIEECVYAFLIAFYEFNDFKTGAEVSLPKFEKLILSAANEDIHIMAAVNAGRIAADAVTLARNLANMPGNFLYPETLALRASEIAIELGISCQILTEVELKSLGAGGLLGVGAGSSHPPRMVILEYSSQEHKQDKPLILVGKGITFDSGGICLKPAANMGQMKCDMSGAAAVLAALAACAKLKLPRRIIGILACAENMPDGSAYRPGDILYALNGQTVEITNTDAEGRLVLADALTYAQKNWTPAALVDIATLTGACAIALGAQLGGLFTDNDNLGRRILAYGTAVGENYWRLPLWQPYTENLKSEVADIKHTGSREGGAITAALFLQNFVDAGLPWTHLDIAGVDWCAKNIPLCREGATGFGTRTLIALARGGWE